MLHTLETDYIEFAATRRGDKRCEYRRNDRNYMEGDFLILREYFPSSQSYGEELKVLVTHIMHGGRFGIPKDFCVMSIKILTTPSILKRGYEHNAATISR